MRKVKIISALDVQKVFKSTNDYEELLNSAFEEINKNQGVIVKTEYGISHSGHLESVIIEYEIH